VKNHESQQMATVSETARAIRGAVELIRDESLAVMDFDELCGRLEAASLMLGRLDRAEAELAVLRQDLTGRIAGMARASAVARGTRRDLETASELTERLPLMSARELVRCYGRVAARFRDTFPASMSAVTSCTRTPHGQWRRTDEHTAPLQQALTGLVDDTRDHRSRP